MDEKTIKFPITHSQKRKNMLGVLNVECQVSGRILHFHEQSDILQGGEFITIDVMAMPAESGSQKKICQVIVTREDLLAALDEIHPDRTEKSH